ncbi:MAG TPA: NADH-quinone oxidoreductase subunit J [Anaerolineae bacterium]|nr:NADH-quinone oxidoreductase subunit J [Anaerolineae bacterium]
MLNAILTVLAVACALQAIRAKRLLIAALWLAGVSAFVAILLYQFGAREVAVIELSVGAGLVTVLFVFAIGLAGEEAMDARALIPKPVAWALVIVSALLLGWMTRPSTAAPAAMAEPSFTDVMWQGRGLDVLVQIVLVFAGVLGVLGLLAEARVSAITALRVVKQPATQPATRSANGNGHSPAPQPVPDTQPEREEVRV